MTTLVERIAWVGAAGAMLGAAPSWRAVAAQQAHADSVSIRIVDLDLRSAVQSLAQYVDRPVIFSAAATNARVTLETPHPVPKPQVLEYLKGLLDSENMDLVADSTGLYRVRPRAPARKIEALNTGNAGQSAAPTSRQESALDLFVIRLKHARASDVAAVVNALYGRASAGGDAMTRQPTLQQQLQQYQVSAATQTPAPITNPSATQPSPLSPPFAPNGRQSPLSPDATIIADAATNSLMIRASRQDFDLIHAAVAQLDIRPLQVIIEVMIAEVRRDRELSFGIDAALGATKVKGTNSTIDGSSTGLDLGDFALHVMGFREYTIDATLRAAASRGDARIVSRPILLAANNEDAAILVGSQRPFVQVSRSLPTDVPSRDQVVEYRDVGTKLTVRPTISADGYVMLQVTQEVNEATAETQFDAPIISTRSIQTRLLVRDGQTAVLGGLTDRERNTQKEGIPILSALPIIGGFFGHASNSSTETELFVFLTPRVLKTDEDADRATAPLKQKADRVNP